MIDLVKRNFWKDYPELTFAPGLEDIYKKDKSKDKKESSQVMWAIHLCESLDSKYYNLPTKYTLVAEKFLKMPNFDWEKISEATDFYREVALSDAERSLAIWNETMRLRSGKLKEMYQNAFTGKDTDELVKLDKMLSTTPKMFDDYKKIKSDYEAEKTQKTGKSIGSMSDADEI